MREIKFRGKEIGTYHWQEGHYVREGNKHFIVDEDQIYMEVFPETVGQFTGLLDNNGNEIYEGDIVQAYHKICDNPLPIREASCGEIMFIEGSFCFCYDNIQLPLIGLYSDQLEVIGNIHDNQELIEGGAE